MSLRLNLSLESQKIAGIIRDWHKDDEYSHHICVGIAYVNVYSWKAPLKWKQLIYCFKM